MIAVENHPSDSDKVDSKRRNTMLREIRNKLSIFSLGLLFAMLASTGTRAQDVTFNFMPGTDFAKYHTYKWITIEGATYPNQILDTQIKDSIDSQLAGKGLTKTDSDKADLYVGYQVSLDQEKQWNAYGMGGGLRWGGGMATAQSSTITVGTLVLDMYDPTNKQLVWTGRATKTLDPGANQQKKQKNLDKGMEKLLKNYPPKQK
jgi:hypothetical protein